MAKFSTLFSRYSTRCSRTSTQYSKDLKSKISKPLPLEEDALPLTTSDLPYSISNIDVAEEKYMDRQSRDLEAEIDDILAQYQYSPTNADIQTSIEVTIPTTVFKSSLSASQRTKRLPYSPPPAPSYEKLVFGMEVWRCSPSESMPCHPLDTRGHSAAMEEELIWRGDVQSCNANNWGGRHLSRTNGERACRDHSAKSNFGAGYGTRRKEKEDRY